MNILVISQFYYPEPFAITSLCEGLVQLGHRVTVVTSQPQYGFASPKEVRRPPLENLKGVTIHRLNVAIRQPGVFSLLRNYYSYYRISKQFVKTLPKGFDIVFSMSLSPLMSVSAGVDYAKKHHVKHVLYAVDLWPEAAIVSGYLKRHSILEKWIRSWSRKLYRAMDFILVGSPGHRTYFTSVHQIQPIKIDVLIQPSLIEQRLINSTRTKNLWVYAGNLGRLQPLMPLIHQLTHPPFASIQLRIIGNGTEKERLQNYVTSLKLNDRVTFLGSLQPEASAIHLQQASVCVIALQAEGLIQATIPSKAIHYLSYGKPIVGLLGKEGKAWLDSIQGTGFIVEDASHIHQAMHQVVSLSEARYQEIQTAIQSYYDQHLSVKSAVQQLERYLIKVNK